MRSGKIAKSGLSKLNDNLIYLNKLSSLDLSCIFSII